MGIAKGSAALKWANPFGDGTAGERIVKLLRDKICSYHLSTEY
jgi:UDP-N-acetylglucosamine 2-epimerase